ncbi:transcriptional regulator [Pseudomonas sp. FW215-R2]|uniref:transcriptional regulator GcvA n=1 Tax=unclassified Pseudomonas TaxID=196821 RepID=UPI000C88B9BF|nr:MULTISPECIES: transcriptional regulator GcvA [unclassified Pseudomonas]PMW99520.1 transcriptional regulator [Pseudomonas sp. FW215-R2]PMX06071.1 transcriptional regulator [Pseudomonas sp. FW215-L1]PMX19455.1 transcriptional regulator [Pseudomonas sp. FW215-E1]PNA24763.1 transcriptional regulator [Pseudomonas sp. FW215-R4]
MLPRLPSLNGLRAFECAARHLSFTRAAEELNVTQTAISHQIRRLEDELGVRLFMRLKDGLALTDEGNAYFPGIRSAFLELRHSTERLLESNNHSVLTISTLVSVASKWLLPRLPSFREAHPEIDVRISASTELVDFRKGGIDAAIRYGTGEWPGLRADWLMSDEIFPVCSPRLLTGENALKAPADLINHPLLQVSGLTANDWRDWLHAAGQPMLPAKGPRMTFDLAMMAVQAAIDGQGVCIGRSTYVEDDLRAGRLVAPFDLRLKSDSGFYFVTSHENADSKKIVAFRQWLSQVL